MGSCFAEKIFHKLNFFQFDALESPFGISFNPIVLANQLDKIIENKRYSEHDLYFHDELLGIKVDKPVFSPEVKALEGKEIYLKGYIIPTDGYKSHKEFA